MSEAEAVGDPFDHLKFDQADRLRRSLRISKVSVQAMADELGVVRDTVGNYINGHTKPPRPTLVVWAMKTGFPLEWLETGELPRLDSNQRPFVSQSPQISPVLVLPLMLPETPPGPRSSEPPRTPAAVVSDLHLTPRHQATTAATALVGGAVVVDLAIYKAGRRAGARRTTSTRRPA